MKITAKMLKEVKELNLKAKNEIEVRTEKWVQKFAGVGVLKSGLTII